MDVRLGYVAMSVNVKNASPSKTMTAKQFALLGDREIGLRKLERIAEENVQNCIRLLHHNRAYGIRFFRLSSRLVPLVGHELTAGWDYRTHLQEAFRKLGEVAAKDGVRMDFHPDHFVVLNTPRDNVLRTSLDVLDHHIWMLEAMGIDPQHRCVLHVGGAYKDKPKALERFVENWREVPGHIRTCLMLENDDKIFTARDTLALCETLSIPMVLDIHHHRCNHEEGQADISTILPRIIATWEHSPLPVKMHVSSPRSEKEQRSHADYVEPNDLLPFLREVARHTDRLDMMLEAKQKDGALLQMMEFVRKQGGEYGAEAITGGALRISPVTS